MLSIAILYLSLCCIIKFSSTRTVYVILDLSFAGFRVLYNSCTTIGAQYNDIFLYYESIELEVEICCRTKMGTEE